MSSDVIRRRFAAPVVCLLPAYNAENFLHRWFESVARFADAVVSLDDGSTDGTADLLERHPLVRVLLRNPTRHDYRDWDDSRNRNRLLEAAAQLAPSWIISLDADELLAEEDGIALRRFIDERAAPGFAYGFPVYRMIGDVERFDRVYGRAFRLFAFARAHRFPADRLHFAQVPASIPRCRWLMTDVRIQHLGEMNDDLRWARRLKYAEADPDRLWEDDADYAGFPAGEPIPWRARRAAQPVTLEPCFPETDGAEETIDLVAPVLSVALIVGEEAVDEMTKLFDTVSRQRTSMIVEVLVLALGDEVADDVARLLPNALVLRVSGGASAAEVRNVALRVAQGDYVVCFDAPVHVAPGALDTLVRAHDAGNAVVTGAVRNGTRSLAGWACYFDGPVHASFAREPLLRLGGFRDRPPDAVERDARDRLLADGHRSGRASNLVFEHRARCMSAGDYLASRWAAGRAGMDARHPLAGLRSAVRGASPETWRALRRAGPLALAGWLASWLGNATRLRGITGRSRRGPGSRRR